MSEQGSRDRLRPFLLDRLTDDRATRRSRPAPRRGPAAATPAPPDDPPGPTATDPETLLDRAKYRERLRRDLMWLMNSRAPADSEGLEKFPEVARSVLNYGIPDITRLTSNGASVREVERWIARAVERFEPRIVAGSLQVRLMPADPASPGALRFEFEADVWMLPEPEPIYLRTEIDVGTGECRVRDR
jgi:type VI secretion system protein ImpF